MNVSNEYLRVVITLRIISTTFVGEDVGKACSGISLTKYVCNVGRDQFLNDSS